MSLQSGQVQVEQAEWKEMPMHTGRVRAPQGLLAGQVQAEQMQ